VICRLFVPITDSSEEDDALVRRNGKFVSDDLIDCMLESLVIWDTVTSFAESVMMVKVIAERERRTLGCVVPSCRRDNKRRRAE